MLRWDLLAQRWQQGRSELRALLSTHPLESAKLIFAEFENALEAAISTDSMRVWKSSSAIDNQSLPFSHDDHERDFRDWIDALNEKRGGEVEISAQDRPDDGLDDFYSQEAEMERQLGVEAEALWLDQWEVPDEPPEHEELVSDPTESATYEEYLEEVEPEAPSYREWDDMDNFWNQEGVFEEMSDLYHQEEDY